VESIDKRINKKGNEAKNLFKRANCEDLELYNTKCESLNKFIALPTVKH